MSEGELTFWILAPIFLALGVYLFIYGRRRSAMMQRFARANGLSHESRPSDEFEDKLSKTFRIEEPGLGRAFSSVRDLIGDGRVRLFKCIEAHDLNPCGDAESSHSTRIAVLFSVDRAHEHWSWYERGGRRLESSVPAEFADPAVARDLEVILRAHPPQHPLSVTFARGKGLAYLQLFYGSEKESDLYYLLKLGRALADCFGDAGARNAVNARGASA